MEVATSYFVDERSWPRPKAAIATGVTIFLLGIPAAMSSHSPLFHEGMKSATAYVFGEESGKSWFGLADYLVGNWMLPLGGLGIALFAAWRLGDATRRDSFKAGSKLGAIYRLWLLLLRYLVPIGVVVILLNKLGVFDWLMSAIGGSG
jgi:NSS family neurotransmitter:Na+ symporter